MSEYVRKQSYVLDSLLQLKDAGLLAASINPTQVDSSDAIIDVGAGRMMGTLIIDATAVEVASGNELYQIVPLFSSDAAMASDIVAGPAFELGDSAVVGGDIDVGVGRYEIPVTNVFNGKAYRYMALKVVISGTIATGINFIAHLAKDN